MHWVPMEGQSDLDRNMRFPDATELIQILRGITIFILSLLDRCL
jgi:hypothetical protein